MVGKRETEKRDRRKEEMDEGRQEKGERGSGRSVKVGKAKRLSENEKPLDTLLSPTG